MSEPIPAPRQMDTTEVHLGMRAMLLLMSVLAVGATALGAFIRSFPPNERASVAQFWALVCVLQLGLVPQSVFLCGSEQGMQILINCSTTTDSSLREIARSRGES